MNVRDALSRRTTLTLVLVAMLAWSVLQIERDRALVHTGGIVVLLEILGGLLRPTLSAEILGTLARAAWQTVAYAVAGMCLAIAIGFPAGILASGVLVRRPGLRRATMVGARTFLAGTRAIHELVWAFLFVAAIGLSPFVAVFAIGIAYGGILGRIFADLLNDVPEGPIESLRAAGAGRPAMLVYGHLAMALPDMVAYTLYRLECAIRSSAIMSFVGLAGLGFQIEIALADLRYGLVATYLYGLMVIVVAVDAWSSEVRRRMVA